MIPFFLAATERSRDAISSERASDPSKLGERTTDSGNELLLRSPVGSLLAVRASGKFSEVIQVVDIVSRSIDRRPLGRGRQPGRSDT